MLRYAYVGRSVCQKLKIENLRGLSRIWGLNYVFVFLGGAIIPKPPLNQTKTEGDVVSMACEGEGTPGNLSIAWYRGDKRIHSVDGLSGRAQVTKEGMLVISELTNGIGRPQRATAYLAIECKLSLLYKS